jgi:hypothetical protein
LAALPATAAVGSRFSVSNTTVANNDYVDLDGFSGADTEGVIQVINHPTGSAQLYVYDGTNSTLVATYTSVGIEYVFLPIVHNGLRYRVKNTSGSSAWISASGVVTK